MQELVSNINGRLQISATVLLKVENQMLHTLRLQLTETLNELLMRRRAEIADADIADAWTYHIGGIDGMDRNLVADDSKLECLADARTHHTQLHLRPFRTTKALHNLFLRHLHTSDGGIVNGDDTVAGDDTHPF